MTHTEPRTHRPQARPIGRGSPLPGRVRGAARKRTSITGDGPRGSAGPARRAMPLRTCVGCGQQGRQHELLRCILDPDGGLVVDLKASAFGRGAWVHRRKECIERAVRHGFSKSFRTRVQATSAELFHSIAEAGVRRVGGLIQAARAGGFLVIGRDAVEQERHQLRLVLLATDAGALRKERFVVELGASGRLVAWGCKQQYGDWLARGDVAIVGIKEHGLASEVARTVALLALTTDASASRDEAVGTSLSEDR